MMARKWIGTQLQRGPDLRVRKNSSQIEKVLEFNGDWAQIEAAIPANGSQVSGMPGFAVVDVDAQRKGGSGGRMLVTVRREGEDADEADETGLLKERLSVRWVRSQRALENSSYFTAGSASDVKMSQIECWKREKDHALRDVFKFRAPVLYGTTVVQWQTFEITDTKTLALARKIKAGQTGYWWWYPVVRWRREYDHPPTPDLNVPTIMTAANLELRVGNPRTVGTTKKPRKHIPKKGRAKDYSGDFQEFDYSYLLTGMDIDEAEGNRFAITEEWLGAESFDADYYGT
jgi:hypothetical protein